MSHSQNILVSPQTHGARVASVACVLALAACLQACGQKGPLTMPNDNDFKQRATLPDIIRRQLPDLPNTSPNKPNTTTPPAPSQPASSAQPPAVNR
ncbi:MAG: hypothetical protein EB125_08045 [Betaproteobacteria bacterium]|jgi:predicted small lipoprotein YifL|nr:hypothetical protein [Betaproteobacteria bacterium]